MFSEESTCWPNGLLIQSCSRPCQKLVVDESVTDAAVPASDSAAGAAPESAASKLLGLEKSAINVSHPAGVDKSVSNPLNTAGSKKSVGLTDVTAELTAEPTTVSRMSSNTSALAVGAPANG